MNQRQQFIRDSFVVFLVVAFLSTIFQVAGR